MRREYTKGSGPEVIQGYSRGDSWIPEQGPHSECEGRSVVQGAGVMKTARGTHPGVLVRCTGCLFSYVIR